MRNSFFFLLIGLAVLFSTTGCYSTLDGQMKPGVSRKDTITSKYERPLDQIVAATKEVLAYNGTIASDDRANNTLTAKVDNRTVYVRVTSIDEYLTQVEVQTRGKYGQPDIDLSSEIDKQIALRLR